MYNCLEVQTKYGMLLIDCHNNLCISLYWIENTVIQKSAENTLKSCQPVYSKLL